MDELSDGQREILEQFQAIADISDIEQSITQLNLSDWNLERAIHLLYDDANSQSSSPVQGGSPTRPATTPTAPRTTVRTSTPTSRRSMLSTILDCITAPAKWTFTIIWKLFTSTCIIYH
jgi:UBA-like domain